MVPMRWPLLLTVGVADTGGGGGFTGSAGLSTACGCWVCRGGWTCWTVVLPGLTLWTAMMNSLRQWIAEYATFFGKSPALLHHTARAARGRSV